MLEFVPQWWNFICPYTKENGKEFLKNGINNIHIVFIAMDNELARSLRNKRSERGKGEMKAVSKMNIRGMKRCGV